MVLILDNIGTNPGNNNFPFGVFTHFISLYHSVFATCTYSSFLCVCYLHDVKNVLKMYQLESGEELKNFPLEVGSIVGFTGRKKDSEIFYYFTSFLSPGEYRQQRGSLYICSGSPECSSNLVMKILFFLLTLKPSSTTVTSPKPLYNLTSSGRSK